MSSLADLARAQWERLGRLPIKTARTLSVKAWGDDFLALQWARQGVVARNWGDKLNPVLARMISGKNVVHAFDVFEPAAREVYYVIGSSLEHAQRRGGVVWGVGFIDHTQGIPTPPRAVHAVRGYRSMERLHALGIACPDVVGDPALLMPRFYRPRPAERRYALGVIPHCFELDLPAVRPEALSDDTLLIDITGGVFEVIDQIAACDFIASSSLHGLICAFAYGVPARWIHLSDRPVGDGFKYDDFYSSIGRPTPRPVDVHGPADLAGIAEGHEEVEGTIDLDRLLAACPFRPGAIP